MTEKKIILLPLDGSKNSLKALIPAQSLASDLNCVIEILYISDENLSKQELIKTLHLTDYKIPECIINHKKGDVSETILAESQRAEYIVMGTHGETEDKNKVAGSISSNIIQNSNKPVLLIRPDIEIPVYNNHWQPHKALIPLNGTPGAAQALLPTIEMLAQNGMEVDILHISTCHSKIPKESGSLTTPYYTDYAQLEWAHWGSEFIRRFCPALEDVNIKYKLFLANGCPACEILKFVKEHKNDLIAMAWHGELGHMKAKTLKDVIFDAPCPVLLIKIA